MKSVYLAFFMSLTMAAAHAQAQSASVTPAPDDQSSQSSAPLSKQERIALCETERGVPLDPADPILRVGGSVTQPLLIHKVKPGPVPGRAVVEAIINEDGCVREPRILQVTDEKIAAQTIKTVEQWVFQPSTLAGRPVSVYYVLTLDAK